MGIVKLEFGWVCCAPFQNGISIGLRLLQGGHVTALGEDQQVAVLHPGRNLVRLCWTADQVERTADDQGRTLDTTEQRSQVAPLVESALPHLHRTHVHFEHRTGLVYGLAHIGTIRIGGVEWKDLGEHVPDLPRIGCGERTRCPIIPDLASFWVPFYVCMSC